MSSSSIGARAFRIACAMPWLVGAVPADAQERLPARLAGVAMVAQGRGQAVVNWTLAIDGQTPEGAFRGRFTYVGQVCQLRDAAIDGTYQQGRLEFAVDKPSPGCQRLGMNLKLSRPGGEEFEGTANVTGTNQSMQGFNYTLTVNAKPP